MMLVRDVLRDLWRLLDARRRVIAMLLILALLVNGALEMVSVLLLFGYIASLSETGGMLDGIYRWVGAGLEGSAYALVAGLFLIAVFGLKNALDLLSNFLLLRFSMKRYEHVSSELFDGYLGTRLDVLQRAGSMEPQRILDSVTFVFRTVFTPALLVLSNLFLLVSMTLVFLFLVDLLPLLIGALVLVVPSILLLSLTRRTANRLSQLRVRAEQTQRKTMLDGFRGLIDARLGNREGYIISTYRKVVADLALADRRVRAIDQIPRSLNELLLAAGIVGAAVYYAGQDGGMQSALPTLAALGFAGLRVTAAMARIAQSIQTMRDGEAHYRTLMGAISERAPDLLHHDGRRPSDAYLETDRPLRPDQVPALTGALCLRDVTYSYPQSDAPAVHDISLEIPKGAFVGFCGPSGSGKSTLALILMGLLKPQSGRVICNDWDIFDHLRTWHANLGYVGQTPFISPRSVRENVAFGYDPDQVDDARVWSALEQAALADVVRGRADGLDAVLGEEGAFLSGGQRQRLSIARALYRDPEVLVFDEATAALDNATERELSQAINSMSGAKTLICIAHRLTTIRHCDIIHYFEDGRIAASGTYAELEANSAGFRKLLHDPAESAHA